MLKDKDIREPLFEFLEETYGRIRIIEEKTMGRSRADVIMVTEDGLTGLEIKSDADTYTRLARQIKDYTACFAYNYVVVGTSHAMHIEEHVPDTWGIITVEELPEGPDFYILRHPKRNREADIARTLSFLWRAELSQLLAANGLPAWTSLSKKTIRQRLIERVPEERLAKQISEQLFERDYTIVDELTKAARKERTSHTRKASGLKRRRKRRTG